MVRPVSARARSKAASSRLYGGLDHGDGGVELGVGDLDR
jgi:hypothetical protein